MIPAEAPYRRIPARTVFVALVLFWISFLLIRFLSHLTDIFAYIAIATFFAAVLTPAVDWCVKHWHLRRGYAATIVVLAGMLLLAGLIYVFVAPIVDQAPKFSKNFPTYLEQAKEGRGPIGDIVTRFNLEDRVDSISDSASDAVDEVKDNAQDIAVRVSKGLAGSLTVFLLTILMLLRGSETLNSFIAPFAPKTRKRLKKIGHDCANAVYGYMFGNILISLVAGLVAFISLWLLDVPFKGILSLWVFVADLIPLVGATLGAVPAILVAFIDSTSSGIILTFVFILYQQFENHVLQVAVMSKTVQLNPIIVLIAVLVGVELSGILGALLAIPVAASAQIVVRDLLADRIAENRDETDSEETPPSVDEKA